MLRLLVLLLLMLNAAYYAWSHDMLRAYGLGPLRQAEPQRLLQQIQPQALVIGSTESPQPVAPPIAPSAQPSAQP